MLRREASEYLEARNRELADRVRHVELIGEISVDEAEVAKLAKALGMDLNSVFRYQHALAVMLVGVARYDYDNEFWRHVSERMGRVLNPSMQKDLGEQFEGYLTRQKLLTFRHLVRDEGALRFLAPILGHTIVPRALVPQFMEKAIWPAVLRGDHSAEAVQQRFAAQPPALTVRPIVRFVLHGGSVARDVIERSIECAVAAAQGDEEAADLPAWLQDEIRTWVLARPGGRRPPGTPGHRRLRPVLKYDAMYGRVTVELPYSDEDRGEKWDVEIPGAGISSTLPAWDEAWRRTSSARVVEIESPFDTLRVTLQSRDQVLVERHYPGLQKQWPAMFFAPRTGRSLPSTGTVAGTEWYVLRRTDTPLVASPPGTLRVREDLGPPLGAWDGYTVERVETAGATTLRVKLPTGDATWWLAEEPLAARIYTADMLQYLAPVGDAQLAFEDTLPQVILPVPPSGESVVEYLARWRFSAAKSGERPTVMEARSLVYSQRQNLEVAVDLAGLIPARNIGTWSLRVTGPIGRGIMTQITVLPRMTFEIKTRPGIAGHTSPSEVRVTAPEGIQVVEADGSAISSGDGWELVDLNQDGRIPFTVVDAAGREATAMVVLPKVQWQWFPTGKAPSQPNQPLGLVPDSRQGVRLTAQGAGSHTLRLSLVDGGGIILMQQLQAPGQGRGAVFEAATFVVAAEELGLPRVKLRLAILDRAGTVLDESEVGGISLTVEPFNLEAELIDGVGVVQWRQAWQVRGEQARLCSLSRPWDQPLWADASSDGPNCTALYSSDEISPGRYEFALFQDDAWTGKEQLGPPMEVRVGSEAAILNRARGLPPTAEGMLERILILTDTSLRDTDLASFAGTLGQYQLADLTDLIARALEQERASELLALSWAPLATNLTQQRISPLPLVKRLASHAGAKGLDAFCSIVGLDRLPALHVQRHEVSEHVRAQAWAVWRPLGAALDLPDAQKDDDARLRCSLWLGFERLEARICPGCLARNDFGEAPCSECERSYDAATWDLALIRECGVLEGPVFRPNAPTLQAMRQALSPLPGKPLDADGWISCALETLEALALEDKQEAESERDATVKQYLRIGKRVESALTHALGDDWLRIRSPQAKQFPWAYCARISLAVALSRRLLARGALQDRLAASETDELAKWLMLWMRPVFEHDLCVAELICCRRMDWA